jgi:hypothetical protein
MRFSRFALLGALVAGAAACSDSDTGPTTANVPPLAFVRYINAVPDTFNMTVRFIDQVQFVPMSFTNVPYRGMGLGNYQGVEAGSQRFRVFTYDPALNSNANDLPATTAMMADTTFTFVAGEHYTILHTGFARAGQLPAQHLIIMQDVHPAEDLTSLQFRVVNATQGGAVDAFATATATTALAGAPAIAGIARDAASAYVTRAAGAFAVQATDAGTFNRLAGTLAPAGSAAIPPDIAVAGSTVPSSVLTAFVFGPSVPGSSAAAAAAPTVVWVSDRVSQP